MGVGHLGSLHESLAATHPLASEGIDATRDAIVGLGAEGDLHTIPVLLPFIVTRNGHRARDVLRDAAHLAAEAIVRRIAASDRMTLDHTLRNGARIHALRCPEPWLYLGPGDVDATVDGPCPQTVAGLLSGHPHGYVRGAAIEKLSPSNPGSLAWLLPRALDWVPSVRIRATELARALLTDAHAFEVLRLHLLLARMEGVSRVDGRPLIDAARELLSRQPDALFTDALRHGDRVLRRATVRLLVGFSRMTHDQLELALDSTDASVRALAALMVTSEPSTLMASCRARLRKDPSGRIRARGLALSLEAEPSRSHTFLESAFDDATRTVRAVARLHFGPSNDAILADRYRVALRHGTASLGTIRGIEEVGVEDDWELLVPMLDSGQERACATIAAMTKLARSETRELRLIMVDDTRVAVSRAATRSLMAEVWETDEGVLARYMQSPTAHVRLHARRLASRMPGWTSVRLLLTNADASLTQETSRLLGQWLVRRAARCAPPTLADRTAILEGLETSTIAPHVRSRLRDFLDTLRV